MEADNIITNNMNNTDSNKLIDIMNVSTYYRYMGTYN